MRALLLDLGGTVLVSGCELLGRFGEHEPAVAPVAARRGPFGPEPDAEWDRMLAGEITERAYWQRRSVEVGAALGRDWTIQEFMNTMHELAGADLVRPEAGALIADARAAGHRVGALTNDMRAFHGDAEPLPILREFDTVVDASVTGVLKPDPRAYAIAAEQLGTPPSEIVFVDDMPENAEGARKAGMITIELDLTAPGRAFAEARAALLPSGSAP